MFAFVLAAGVTEPTVIAQLSLAGPLLLLYEGLVRALRPAESKPPRR